MSVGGLAARPGQGGGALPHAATMPLLLLVLVGEVAISWYQFRPGGRGTAVGIIHPL
jgi:hypothetical protein